MADIPTVAWDETSPAGSQVVSLGDDRIRELKTQTREVVDVDHKFDSSGQDADMGKHTKCSFIETANLGTGAEGLPILGAQTVDGKAELVFTDEEDNDIQITKDGYVLGESIRMQNDTYFKSLDAAGTGTVSLIKAGTNDLPTLPDGAEMATSGAPTEDEGIANKKYVDDKYGFVEAVTISADATAVVTGILSGYDYIFSLQNVLPATDNVTLYIRTSSDAGVSYDSGASDYADLIGATEAQITSTAGIGNATGEGISCDITVFNPGGTTHTQMLLSGIAFNTTGVGIIQARGGKRNAAADVDAIQFLFSSGNLASGTINVFRRKLS